MNLKLLKYNVMVRKIKFRGKDIDTGEWRYGYLSFFYTAGRDKNGFILTDKAQIYSQEDGRCYDVLAETVGQFTGKTDKNKKEIYEGDIVRVYSKDGTFNIVVKWSNDSMGFMACYVDGNQSPFSWFTNLLTYELEVIGNIHDNPELLKGDTK